MLTNGDDRFKHLEQCLSARVKQLSLKRKSLMLSYELVDSVGSPALVKLK